MTGASLAHATIVVNLGVLIHGQLARRQWTVLMHFGLDVGPQTIRCPDIVVDRAGGGRSDRVATAPVVLIEVMSPDTAEIDLGDKVADYLSLPTLAAYLVFAQEAPKCWARVRGDTRFSPAPPLILGLDQTIRLATPPLELPLSAVYANLPAS
jgi:Uma2 family endonuclease